MTLLKRAFNLFSTTQKSSNRIEPLNVADIISSISSNSNDWNKAAVSLAADHEKSSGKRISVVCYPANIVERPITFPVKTTTEWNVMALKLLLRTKRSRKKALTQQSTPTCA